MNSLYCILFNQHDYQINKIIYLGILDLQREEQDIPRLQLLVNCSGYPVSSVHFSRSGGWLTEGLSLSLSQTAGEAYWKGTGLGARKSETSSAVSLGKSLSLYNAQFFHL